MRIRFARTRTASATLLGLVLATIPARGGDDAGPLVRSLWLVQRYGRSEVLTSENDQKLKGKLSRGLSGDGILTASEMREFMEPTTFNRLAGTDSQLDPAEIQTALNADTPASRLQLPAKLKSHADLLTTSFDRIDPPHLRAGDELVDWIVANYRPGQPLHVTVVCTGNSRRSILGSTMGNVASAYYGMPEIRFHSGGTAPSAFNRRTVASLREIGVEIEPTGAEAPRGEPTTANPIYRVRWGTEGSGLETTEFSKLYADPANPQTGFAALMVCSEADAGCPVVRGVSLRVSMPYFDPKIYDDSPFQAAKYAERRDDLGRLLLQVMMRVRNQRAPH